MRWVLSRRSLALGLLLVVAASLWMLGRASAQDATAPTAPTISTLTTGSGWIDVAWSAPSEDGGSPIRGYLLAYRMNHRDAGEHQVWTKQSPTSATQQRISGLVDGSEYYIRVRARNDHGASAWSERHAIRVGTPSRPTQLQANPYRADPLLGFSLSWQAPANVDLASISHYLLRFRKYRSGDAWTVLRIPRANAHSGDDPNGGFLLYNDLHGIADEVDYILYLRAVNANGGGKWSEALRATNIAPPEAPVLDSVKATERRARLKWSQPDSGGSVHRYEVSFAPTSTPSAAQTATTRNRMLLIKGLTPGTEYTFKVRARNQAGQSAWSNSITATPGATSHPSSANPPATPTNLLVTPKKYRFDLSWDADASATSFEVSYTNLSTNAEQTATTAEKSLSLTGLDRVSYGIKVRALNESGQSDWTSAVTKKPHYPPAPPIIEKITPGQYTVWVQFTLSSDNGNPPDTNRFVHIEHRAVGETSWTRNFTSPTGYLIGGLSPETPYELRLRRVAGHNSPWTAIATFTTDPLPKEPGSVQSFVPDTLSVPGQVTLKWTPPRTDVGGAPTSYEIQFTECPGRTLRNCTNNVTTVTVSADTLSYTLTVTDGKTVDYRLRIRAVNDDGAGPWWGSPFYLALDPPTD